MWQSVEILNDFNIFRLKQIFWKTVTYFQPIFRFLVGGSKTGNASNKKLPYQKSMLRKIKWWVKNGPITKNGVLPLPTSFFWKSCFSLRTSYKELIWWTYYPNVHIHTFVSAGVFFGGAFSLWISLSLRIQGKVKNINSAFFCSTFFYFAFLSTLNVKRTETYANENVRLKNPCSFVE